MLCLCLCLLPSLGGLSSLHRFSKLPRHHVMVGWFLELRSWGIGAKQPWKCSAAQCSAVQVDIDSPLLKAHLHPQPSFLLISSLQSPIVNLVYNLHYFVPRATLSGDYYQHACGAFPYSYIRSSRWIVMQIEHNSHSSVRPMGREGKFEYQF